MTKARDIADGKFENVDVSGDLTLDDNYKIKLGTGNDMSIFHNGSNSFVSEGGTGNLRLQGTAITFENAGGTEYARLNSDGRFYISKSDSAEATVGIRFDGSSSGQGRGFFTANNNYLLVLRRNSGNGSMIIFKRDATTVGSISATTTQTNYNTSSDYRLKENVEDMTGAITRVKQLQPRRFSWIVDDEDAANVDGFLAHEAQSVVPEAVIGTHNEVDDDGNPVYQGIDQSKLVPLLTGALQEAIAKIEALEARVDALENA